ELPAFGQLDIVKTGVATLRSRGVNLWLFIQNIAQLNSIYDEDVARTIIGNSSVLQFIANDELNELEYISKLIGEEFYDVPSVSISEGTSETNANAVANTHTINNSASIAKTQGTADTTAEAKSSQWSTAIQKNRNTNHSIQKTSVKGTGSQISNSKTNNTGTGNTYERQGLFNKNTHKNNNKGHSAGSGYSQSEQSSISDGTGITKGVGWGLSNTKGGGQSNTTSHTDNRSTTDTQTHGEAFGETHTQTKSNTNSVNRTVTVKKERMKIETVRTIREKLSGPNQLLKIRGYQPFFTPKMSYFARYADTKTLIFPDLASIISFDIYYEILHAVNFKPVQVDFKEYESIQSLDLMWNKTKRTKPYDTIRSCAHFLYKILPLQLDNLKKIKALPLNIDLNKWNELIGALGGFVAILNDNTCNSEYSSLINSYKIYNQQSAWFTSFKYLNKEKIEDVKKEVPFQKLRFDNGQIFYGQTELSPNDVQWLSEKSVIITQPLQKAICNEFKAVKTILDVYNSFTV
ncbi:MAG: TraM recognition domain-containing protein, partial [Bacteroidales bacterium]|nr:TraM recognition domain-containing protein [Bacteroidales bacterium]